MVSFFFILFLQEEGEYEGIISAYNPINGWMSSDVFKLAVSEPIGPISISDGTVITDMVSIGYSKIS